MFVHCSAPADAVAGIESEQYGFHLNLRSAYLTVRQRADAVQLLQIENVEPMRRKQRVHRVAALDSQVRTA